MDGGPTIYVLVAIIIVLIIMQLAFIITFRKSIVKKIKKARSLKKEEITEDEVIEEEIISMVKEGHEQGVLLDSEAEMIHNIFEFGEKEAKDIMTHRKSIEAIDGDMSYYDMVAVVGATGRSRFPVFVDDIDNIIGVLHIKDAFLYCQKNELFRTSVKDIPELIREVDFVPETMNVNTLFKKMQLKKSHMCIVVDEYGQTSGLVAMEDILEEIVGEIEDEHDEEEHTFSMESDGSYTFEGLTELRDVLEVIDIPVEEDAFETLNGLVVSLLKKVPDEDDLITITAYGYDFKILSVEDRIIREVRITKSYFSDSDDEAVTLRDS